MIVVADTGPLRYLILIGHVQILGQIFDRVLMPDAVARELSHERTPELVKTWMVRPPDWLKVCSPPYEDVLGLDHLDEGEYQAIALARQFAVRLLLMDDVDGRIAAQSLGLGVLGTVGILERAAELKLLDFTDSFAKLEETNFHMSDAFRRFIRDRHTLGGKPKK
jgi:predicted nucleic acid-binding protein